MRRCLKIKVIGKVQGVFYRDFVQKSASTLGIEGTVQNEENSVLIFACGDAERLDSLIDELYKGSPKSKVENVLVEPLQQLKDFRGVFRIIGANN
jgi:acylphosphatase